MRQNPIRVAALAALLLANASALAHENVKCEKHPKEEWKPHTELQKTLEDKGWQIRRMEKTETCYEVYGQDPEGKRVAAFFDPKTFERVEPR